MGSRDYSAYFHNCEVEVWSCELSAVFLESEVWETMFNFSLQLLSLA